MRHPRHRQERWLHTRISEDLEEALKREARRQRQPVSLLVRNVLEGALDLVEDIVEDGLAVANRAQRFARSVSRGPRTRGDRIADVYGWQELILNRKVHCARCDVKLGAGGTAYRGLQDEPGGPPVFLCPPCVRGLRQPDHPSKEETA